MPNLNGIEVPAHFNGIGLHDTPGAEAATWDYDASAAHAQELRDHGVTLYKLFGSGTKGNRARAYRDNGIVVLHRWWPGGAHWGSPASQWLMPYDQYTYLRDSGVSLFEPGWNEFNIADEWTTDIPGAAGIAQAVLDAWETAGDMYGGYGSLLFPSNTPGGHVDHRACYHEIVAEIARRGLVNTVRHVAIHPRPFNNPPMTEWSATNTVTFDEWRWIRDQFESIGVNAYYWATEHGYFLDAAQNSEYPPIDLGRWTGYNWTLFKRMNPGDQDPIEPELAGVMYWFNAGWGHWGPWAKDALVDSPDPAMPAPSPLWIEMGENNSMLEFARYGDTPTPERAKGFMASEYQEPNRMNWDLLAEDFDYVLIQVTSPDKYPTGYTCVEPNKYLDQHIAAANLHKLPKSGFHFLVYGLDGQANEFAKAAARAEWELPLWTDVEEDILTRDRVDKFNRYAPLRLSEHGVVYPVLGIYTNLKMWNRIGPWYDMPLNLAQWGVDEPAVEHCTFWQYGGGDIPDSEYTSLEVYMGTKEEMYEHYQIEEEEESEMWNEVGFADVELVGVTRERFDEFWGVNMKRFVPTDMPAGSVYYKLVNLSWREGWCGLTLKVIDENGTPIEGEQVFQGWDNPEKDLPPNTAPLGGQPPGYPHTGAGGFTNANGDHGWGWGEGEWFNPAETEGPHWYWRGGENGAYSDVTCGHGWWDEHEVLEPTFMRVIVEDGNGGNGEPEPGTITIKGTIDVDLTITIA